MAKKGKLKSALTSQQSRLKNNAKAKAQEALHIENRRNQKQSGSASTSGSNKNKKTGNNATSRIGGTTKSLPTPLSEKGKGKRRSTVPYQETDRILLIGEGNFSFARALILHSSLRHLPAVNLTATAYDSEEECFEKYPEAREIVQGLKERGVEVLFNVDATALQKCKALKGRRWNRVAWNFPHAGKGITDQDRNILSNQLLLLGFLRSVSQFLVQGPIPKVHTKRKRKKTDDDMDSDNEVAESDHDELEGDYVSDEEMGAMSKDVPTNNGTRGTVLITLRNVAPYTEWDVPKLAKNPPPPQTVSAKPNPRYIQLRSFAFYRSDWEGYEHRMTKGERHGAHGKGTGTTGQGGEDRTWEFCLKDPE